MADQPLSLIINAGGESRRMGRAKSLLPLPPDDTPLIVRVLRRLAPLVTERVVVVSNDPLVAAVVERLDQVLVVPDRWTNGGALGGIATGLGLCSGWAIVAACDMPFVDASIFTRLLEMADGQAAVDAVIPRVAGKAQPFHGLWHRRSLPVIEAQLMAGELGVQAALTKLKVRWVDDAMLQGERDPRMLQRAFFNVNTPQEWAELLRMLGESSAGE